MQKSFMRLTELFLHQLQTEAENSRKALARVPDGRNDWRPHPKSMPLGNLATLVATMPGWIATMIEQDTLDFAPPGGQPPRPPVADSQPQRLAQLEESTARARAALEKSSDEFLNTPWRLLAGGRLIVEQPRSIFIRDVFTHLAHHRGQLTVYLRLNEAAVPALYGPSADERF